nr:hypothetical protein [Tanacetum cinerariifolium]
MHFDANCHYDNSVPVIIRSDTLLNQHDNEPVVPKPVLVDEDEDPKEDEFEEEEDPQEEEDDMESEPEDAIEVENPIEHEDETVPASVHETMHALVEKKGKTKDEFYGKLILDLSNEVRSSVEQGTTAMEKPVEKHGNAKDKVECNKLKKELEEAMFSNTFLRMQNERVERDLYWTRVRAHEFYQEMIHRGFMFKERSNEAINVPIEDEKSPSSELRGSPYSAYLNQAAIRRMIKDNVDAAIAAERARQANVRNEASGSGLARGQDATPATREITKGKEMRELWLSLLLMESFLCVNDVLLSMLVSVRSSATSVERLGTSQVTVKQDEVGEVHGRAYAIKDAELKGSNVVTGTFLLDNRYAFILFDSCSDRSFVDTRFMNHVFEIDLMPIELGTFDVIIGIDWLVKHDAIIVCGEKVVRIPYGNKMLIVESNKDTSKEKQMKDVPVIYDFPKELPGLPPTRQVEFQIDLGAPVLFTKKKDGSFKICKDYRELNMLTVKNRYPLMRIDDLFDQLQGSSMYSKIDLRSGYHQLRIKEEDIQITAFRTWYGHFKFQDEEENEKLLKIILKLVKKERLYAKFSKSDFWLDSVQFLGHVIDRSGVYVDLAKVEAIKSWAAPTTPTE